MNIKNIKVHEILNNKIALFYMISFGVIGIVSYAIIFAYDLGRMQQLDRSLAEVTANTNAMKAVSSYKKYISEFSSKLTVDKGATWLIENISQAAETDSIELKLLKPVDPGSYSGLKVARVYVEGKASYNNMMLFISHIELGKKYVFIEDFAFSSEDRPGSYGRPMQPQRPSMGPGAAYPPQMVAPMLPEKVVGEKSGELDRLAVFKLTIACFGSDK